MTSLSELSFLSSPPTLLSHQLPSTRAPALTPLSTVAGSRSSRTKRSRILALSPVPPVLQPISTISASTSSSRAGRKLDSTSRCTTMELRRWSRH